MSRTRLDLLHTLPRGVGAELGVFRGDFAAEILARVQPTRLWLVDTFCGPMMSGDANGRNHQLEVNMADMPAALRARFALSPAVQIVQAVSWEWLADRPVGSLDWCYIDTDHTYATTVKELAAARQAVRPGGLICGHDYCAMFPGVVRAVQEFADSHALPLDIWSGDDYASYRLINP
jgi:hypothetical protein